MLSYNLFAENKPLSTKVLKASADSIKIIHELNDVTDEFRIAHNLINNSEQVCFIGFGYNSLNLNRLIRLNKEAPIVVDRFMGTAYKLGDAERHNIEKLFNSFDSSGIKLAYNHEDALDFLKRRIQF